MAVQLEIRIGLGFSELPFGATMDEAQTIFGKADNEEDVNDFEDHPSIVWHYHHMGLSLFFDANNNKPFVCADVENKQTQLWGNPIFMLNEKQVIELFKQKGIYLYETEHHEWGEKRLSFDEANVDFYFVNNKMVSVNYGMIAEGTQTLILPN